MAGATAGSTVRRDPRRGSRRMRAAERSTADGAGRRPGRGRLARTNQDIDLDASGRAAPCDDKRVPGLRGRPQWPAASWPAPRPAGSQGASTAATDRFRPGPGSAAAGWTMNDTRATPPSWRPPATATPGGSRDCGRRSRARGSRALRVGS